MKILIVGAGIAGAVFARLAAENNINVDIIDRRNHIGGNCYSYKDEETGIEVHKYGSHIFHTSNKKVWHFINRFTQYNRYINRVKAVSNGKVYSLPVNLGTINQFYGKAFSPIQAEKFINEKRVQQEKINNFEDYILHYLGEELYEAFYKNYTIKQWGVPPKKIPVSTAKRLPIRFNYNDNYYSDKYQGIPVDGYAAMFKRMLGHTSIKIKLETNFDEFAKTWREKYRLLVFTGSLDDYYNYEYGDLPYRTVVFEEIRGKEIQGNAVINYTDCFPAFTRIHEHKWFTPEKKFDLSVGFKEYAADTTSKYNPFYPVQNTKSKAIFKKYTKIAENESNVLFIGRLAEFRYYDMDQVIASSITKFEKWANGL